MTFRKYAIEFWRAQLTSDDLEPNESDLVDAVLQDPALTRSAVVFAVGLCRKDVDRYARSVLTGTGVPPRPRESAQKLVDQLIEHGLTLLDMRLGRLALKDYRPDDLRVYAQTRVRAGKTEILRGHFAAAVADACIDPDATVGAQLSLGDIVKIRDRIVEACPEPLMAESTLSIGATTLTT